MQLSDTLQNRLDDFHLRFGDEAELQEHYVWQVINTSKPQADRVPVIVQGSVIDRFVFNGFYDIELIGGLEEAKSDQVEARKLENLAEAQKSVADISAAAIEAKPSPSKSKRKRQKE